MKSGERVWAGCCESEVGLGTYRQCNTVVGPLQTTCSWCEVLMNLTRDKFNSAVKTEDGTFLASGEAKFGARDWVSPSQFPSNDLQKWLSVLFIF